MKAQQYSLTQHKQKDIWVSQNSFPYTDSSVLRNVSHHTHLSAFHNRDNSQTLEPSLDSAETATGTGCYIHQKQLCLLKEQNKTMEKLSEGVLYQDYPTECPWPPFWIGSPRPSVIRPETLWHLKDLKYTNVLNIGKVTLLLKKRAKSWEIVFFYYKENSFHYAMYIY